MTPEPAAEPVLSGGAVREVSLRQIAPAAFVPTGLFAVGQGAIAPVVVISAQDLGATPGMAALIVALAGVGQIIADVPAGALSARFGERPAMVGASVLSAVALAACLVAPNLAVFGAAILVTGMGTAVWQLARQAYVTEAVPFHMRARAMSTLGGSFRIGIFVGPFLGSAAMAVAGIPAAYAVHLVMALLAAGIMLLARDLTIDPPDGAAGRAAPQRVWPMMREHRPVLTTLGVGAMLISAVRASRQVVLPLWGVHLGLSASTVSLIFGVSGAIDMLFFYPAGRVMDRYGRTWVAVPSMVVLAGAHLALPLAESAVALTVVGLVMGLGNGMGSGIIMTLGADLAPPGQRPVFLGIWRLFADTGNGAGPFMLAGITAAVSLAAASLAMGGVGLIGAAMLGYWIPRRGRPKG